MSNYQNEIKSAPGHESRGKTRSCPIGRRLKCLSVNIDGDREGRRWKPTVEREMRGAVKARDPGAPLYSSACSRLGVTRGTAEIVRNRVSLSPPRSAVRSRGGMPYPNGLSWARTGAVERGKDKTRESVVKNSREKNVFFGKPTRAFVLPQAHPEGHPLSPNGESSR